MTQGGQGDGARGIQAVKRLAAAGGGTHRASGLWFTARSERGHAPMAEAPPTGREFDHTAALTNSLAAGQPLGYPPGVITNVHVVPPWHTVHFL